jgi:WD40 repeat protein
VTVTGEVIQIWGLKSARVTHRLSAGHVAALAISGDGSTLATVKRTNLITLWDTNSGKAVRHLTGWTHDQFEDEGSSTRAVPDPYVFSLSLSWDGKLLAAWYGGSKSTFRVWDAGRGVELWKARPRQSSPAKASENTPKTTIVGGHIVAFSKDAHFLAALGDDGINLYDAVEGRQLRHFAEDRPQLFTVEFSGDAKTLCTAGIGPVRLWNVATGREITKAENWQGIGHLALSPDSRVITTAADRLRPAPDGGSSDLTAPLRYWQTTTGTELVAQRRENKFPPCEALSADGALLASFSGTRLIDLWKVSTGERLRRIPCSGEIDFCQFSPDGTLVLVVGRDLQSKPDSKWTFGRPCMELWEVATGRRVGRLPEHLRTFLVGCVLFSPNGRMIASAIGNEAGVFLWDVVSWRQLHRLPAAAMHLAYSADSRSLATAARYEVTIWDVKSGSTSYRLPRAEVEARHPRGVEHIAFLPGNKTLATADIDGTVCLWDSETGSLRVSWQGNDGPLRWLIPSSDGKAVVTGDNRAALVWDVGKLLRGDRR